VLSVPARFGQHWICPRVVAAGILARAREQDVTMLNFKPPVVLQLSAGQLLNWHQSAPVQLRVLRGRVWVTRTGDLDDHFLDAGQGMRLAPRAGALIGAEGPAQLVFEAEAGHAAARADGAALGLAER
jgi:Protein of unknown function (DUF2917)